MIVADIKFHNFIYELSENSLIAPLIQVQGINTQRVMGEVLMRDGTPRNIWNQHEAMLDAVIADDGMKAETMACNHITQAADFVIHRLCSAAPTEDVELLV